ncbi:MAG: hypothetical protein BMS9Abin26_0348 [Gammaproteobacteria bacterium]|nr:MAG: hypothetical protein BMS9Abin26_0348 [Gammaproteobacteria bacterium]
MKKFSTYLAILIFLFLLSACVYTSNLKDGVTLEKGYGVIVTTMYSNRAEPDSYQADRISYLFRSIKSGGSSGSITMEREQELIVVSLPAGEYNWEEILFDRYYRRFDKSSTFFVYQNTITYIGDIKTELKQGDDNIYGYYKVIDNFDVVKQQLAESYPALSKRYKFKKLLTNLDSTIMLKR